MSSLGRPHGSAVAGPAFSNRPEGISGRFFLFIRPARTLSRRGGSLIGRTRRCPGTEQWLALTHPYGRDALGVEPPRDKILHYSLRAPFERSRLYSSVPSVEVCPSIDTCSAPWPGSPRESSDGIRSDSGRITLSSIEVHVDGEAADFGSRGLGAGGGRHFRVDHAVRH